MKASASVALVLAGLALLSGCASVAPYERGHLARRGMDADKREGAREAFQGHVQSAREGAIANHNAAGGGCGCN